ncbi:hypothetical protein [Sphingomonas crusticola]|uniref:hypothetical protein n=1 Tax=Sphingomonas crusticola TaxID=1697973 RepID=UPI0013C31827|nr:hypothetical protein [Sphingomonas crusticola]
MYLIALLSFVMAAFAGSLAYIWHRAPEPAGEHWVARRKRVARVRMARVSALYLGLATIVSGGVGTLLSGDLAAMLK